MLSQASHNASTLVSSEVYETYQILIENYSGHDSKHKYRSTLDRESKLLQKVRK